MRARLRFDELSKIGQHHERLADELSSTVENLFTRTIPRNGCFIQRLAGSVMAAATGTLLQEEVVFYPVAPVRLERTDMSHPNFRGKWLRAEVRLHMRRQHAIGVRFLGEDAQQISAPLAQRLQILNELRKRL